MLGSRIAIPRTVTRRSTQSDAVSTLATADRYVVTPSDEFFFALEGRVLEANGRTWRIEVCGVHATPTDHWLQLHLRGPVSQGLTLRVPELDAAAVVEFVRDWLEGSLSTELEIAVTGRAYYPAVTS
jgi:hypothetical protein